MLGTVTGVKKVTVCVVKVELFTVAACVPTKVRVPPGKVPVVCVYKLMVTG